MLFVLPGAHGLRCSSGCSGFYGEHPSLTDLDQGDLKMTTDFRSVYATAIEEWMGYDPASGVLKADFKGLGILR